MRWRDQVLDDHRALTSLRPGVEGQRELDRIGPRLVDTTLREELAAAMAGRPATLARGPGLRYTTGVLAAAAGDEPRAIEAFMIARSELGAHGDELASRIALELGRLYLLRGEQAAADAVLAWAEGAVAAPESCADLYLLRALLAKSIGDHAAAVPLERSSIAARRRLTPMSSVQALMNIAVALHHQAPNEGLAVCRLALAMIDAETLHASIRPAARNIAGYATMCSGDLRSAKEAFAAAAEEAGSLNDQRVRLFAEFNRAITEELEGDLDASRHRLDEIRLDADRVGLLDVARWSAIRHCWIGFRNADQPRALLAELPKTVPDHFAEAVATLRALIGARLGMVLEARQALDRLVRVYREKNDALTAFVLQLWSAHLDHELGRDRAARRSVAEACEIGIRRGFSLSPNWWAPEIVVTARALAPATGAEYAASLHLATGGSAPSASFPSIILAPTEIAVDRTLFPDDQWREGKSGRNVLQRFFRLVLEAGPRGAERDALAFGLWPESDGDVAVRNLYWATRDLRVVLSRLPGVALIVQGGRYRLKLASNVTVVDRTTQKAWIVT